MGCLGAIAFEVEGIASTEAKSKDIVEKSEQEAKKVFEVTAKHIGDFAAMATNMGSFDSAMWETAVGFVEPLSSVIEQLRAKMEIAAKPKQEVQVEYKGNVVNAKFTKEYCGEVEFQQSKAETELVKTKESETAVVLELEQLLCILLSVSCKHGVGSRSAAWRIFTSVENQVKNKGNMVNASSPRSIAARSSSAAVPEAQGRDGFGCDQGVRGGLLHVVVVGLVLLRRLGFCMLCRCVYRFCMSCCMFLFCRLRAAWFCRFLPRSLVGSLRSGRFVV